MDAAVSFESVKRSYRIPVRKYVPSAVALTLGRKRTYRQKVQFTMNSRGMWSIYKSLYRLWGQPKSVEIEISKDNRYVRFTPQTIKTETSFGLPGTDVTQRFMSQRLRDTVYESTPHCFGCHFTWDIDPLQVEIHKPIILDLENITYIRPAREYHKEGKS